jgi:hypothetical protein
VQFPERVVVGFRPYLNHQEQNLMGLRPSVFEVKAAIESSHTKLLKAKKHTHHTRAMSWGAFAEGINDSLGTKWSYKRITAEIKRVKQTLAEVRKTNPELATAARLPSRLPSDDSIIAKRALEREAAALAKSLLG